MQTAAELPQINVDFLGRCYCVSRLRAGKGHGQLDALDNFAHVLLRAGQTTALMNRRQT